MQFGFTLKPEHTIERHLDLTRRAEAAGFDYGWLFDSHVLWREPYPLLTLMAGATKHLRLGTCVTNPATREPTVTASAIATLNDISGGRMDLGIGRGDSARRVLGKGPTSMAMLEETAQLIRDLAEGKRVEYEGTWLELEWAPKFNVPLWIAGYGPRAMELAGRIADGIMIQLADPDLIRWFVGQVRAAARAAGRDPAAIRIMAAAPAHVGDIALCRDRTRWFPALVSNHVVDLVNRYAPADLPRPSRVTFANGPATTTSITPRSGPRMLPSWATRSRTASASWDNRRITSGSSASLRLQAWTSSTST